MRDGGSSGRISNAAVLALSLAALVVVGVVSFVLEGGMQSIQTATPPTTVPAAPTPAAAPPPTPPPTYITNNAGFHDDRDYALAKPADATRVVFVGDSMTFGFGVSIEETLVRQTEKKLEATPPAPGKTWQILNMGQLALNTTAELDLIRDQVVSYSPDVLVLMYHLNDALSAQASDLGDPQTTAQMLSGYVLTTLDADQRRKVKEYLESSKADMAALEPGKYDLKGLALFAEYRVSHFTPVYWDVVLKSFDELAALAKEKKFVVVAGIIPALDFPWAEYAFKDVHEKVAEAMRERGFQVVDLLPVLSKRANAEVMLGGVDGHPSPLADQIIGETMAEAVRKAVAK
jgi:lysophospholipase L1-like esterase